MEKKKKGSMGGLPLPQPSPSDLMGRQSVRATFRLSERAVNAISIISVHLGIKQKSVIDHLLEDTEALSLIAKRVRAENSSEPRNRIQKTYVISRRTLSCLERVARDFNTPRDALVEYSVKRLLPMIATEREKHRKRKVVLRELVRYLKEGEKILEKSADLLGENDPVYRVLESGITGLFDAHKQISSFIERGKMIEEYER